MLILNIYIRESITLFNSHPKSRQVCLFWPECYIIWWDILLS